MNHIQTGRNGENLAIAYLEQLQYKILEKNWRHQHKEIDIIALSLENTLVFVEVKTRKSLWYGNPEEAVDEKKQNFLIEAADVYIAKQKLDLDVRFDIISIVMDGNTHTIDHIQEAFYPNF